MADRGDSGLTDEEGGRAVLQERLGQFALAMGAVAVLGTLAVLLTEFEELGREMAVLLGALSAVYLASGVALRRVALSRLALRGLEVFLLALVAAVGATIAHLMAAEYRLAQIAGSLPQALGTWPGSPTTVLLNGSMSASIAMTQAFVLRAALVPSRPLRTIAYQVGGGGLFIAGLSSGVPGVDSRAVLAELPAFAGEALVLGPAIWWVLTSVVCVAVSVVIHGLRREVREAKQLGVYRLEEKLGEGGMGVVYRARHALLRRPTAVKLLPPEKVGTHSLARFEREVQLTAGLTHPNTVTVFDYGRTPDGVFYYAMELLDGATLSEVVAVGGPMPARRVVHVLKGVTGALAEAHALGLVHRDLKPGNVMLCQHGGRPDVPKLLDFGLVKDVRGGQDITVTQDQTLAGTPHYMAPEVIRRADAAGPASDLYALGAVAYFLLTGEQVFDGGTVVEVCSQHLHEEPEPPSRRLGARVPEMLEELVLDCLAKRPEDRPRDADDLRARLDSLEGVPLWTLADAERWWDAHRDALRGRDRAGVDPEGTTLATRLSGDL